MNKTLISRKGKPYLAPECQQIEFSATQNILQSSTEVFSISSWKEDEDDSLTF